jgi:List-Bact-rpt repeat protein
MIFAGTSGGGVFTSTDGGTSWNAMNDGLTNPFVYALAIVPQTATSLYAGTGGGVFGISLPMPYSTMTVSKVGRGEGTVTSAPPGIDCGADCSESYESGTTVTLTATPSFGSIFTGWMGCDSVEGTSCTVTMNAAASVTARFDRERFTLTASKSGPGRGTITSHPPGIDCGADCSESYIRGTTVTLAATPARGSIFTGWRGCNAVSGATCTVIMNADRSVTANFLSVRTVIRFED